MVTPTQTAEHPWKEIGQTDRLWIKSPQTATGLLKPDQHSDPFDLYYWKYRLPEKKFRVRSMLNDKKLDPLPVLESLQTDGEIRLLSYKPESRLAVGRIGMPRPFFTKLYTPQKFPDMAARARAFVRRFGEQGMRLMRTVPSENRIDWEWIEGRKTRITDLAPELPIRILGLERGWSVEKGSVAPTWTPRKIAKHLADRIAAFETWVPILMPNRLDSLRPVLEHSRLVIQRLGEREASRRLWILHGDFRPRNVLFDSSGAPRLCDSDHLAIGDLEWDLAAWLADLEISRAPQFNSHVDTLTAVDFVSESRLLLYQEVWSLIYRLKKMEACPE